MEDKDETTSVESVSVDSEVATVTIANVTGKKMHANSTKKKLQDDIASAVLSAIQALVVKEVYVQGSLGALYTVLSKASIMCACTSVMLPDTM